jgi:hypothetical protein
MISACALRQLASAKLTYFPIMRLDRLASEARLVVAIAITINLSTSQLDENLVE